jgi:pyruvate dehydrogenase E1 component
MRYLHARRAALGGCAAARRAVRRRCRCPAGRLRRFALQADGKEMSHHDGLRAHARRSCSRTRSSGPRVVPIVADEARTFGMANLFRQVGIYSPRASATSPRTSARCCTTARRATGQILEEGITEAGALASWIAAATSYSDARLAMLPFYIYYSMFGFQRVGDLIWAAADQRARGFLIGATAGRTTLGGEGLQHQDGSSHLVAATVPNCRAWDPAFAGELAVIVDHGLREHARAAARRVLLRHRDEREPAAALAARRRARRRAARHVPAYSMFCTCSERSAGKPHGCWVSGFGLSGGYTCGYTGNGGRSRADM